MKTILIIDRAIATLLMLKEEFEEAGYEVLITGSGKEALELLNDPAKNVNLVITNLRHAGPNNLHFMRLIKNIQPKLPIICHTALHEYQELPADDRPFNAFVEKSSDLTVLKESVAELIDKMEKDGE